MNHPGPSPEAVREQLERIVSSPGFVSAGRLRPFLTFVVERALSGEPVKESIVGTSVFGRAADYDPRLDPIVRVEARRLRARLTEYYEGVGATDGLLVSLPKGTYQPTFALRLPPAAEPAAPRTLTARAPRWAYPASALALVLAVAGVTWLAHERSAAPRSVAVLPFVDLSDTPASDFFGEGLSAEIVDRLARIRGLRVVARSSSFRFKGARDAREVGRSLGADAVLEGSVRRAGSRLRVTAQLVSAQDGFHLWSQSYEREAQDVFAIQDDVARAIAGALRLELRVEPLSATPPTASVRAYDLYLDGRHHLNHATTGLELAADRFQRAIDEDPRYAGAHAALAETMALLAYYKMRPAAEAWSSAGAAAERALALDPSLAEAHAVLGLATAVHRWQWAEAEPHFRRALELGPESVDVQIAQVWGQSLPRGRLTEAAAGAERAVELDPQSSLAHQLRSFVLLVEGRLQEAILSYRRATELNPSHGDIQWDLGMALAYAGERDAAMRQFRLGGNLQWGGRWQPGVIEWALLGDAEKARAALVQGSLEGLRPLFVAYAYAALGDAEHAADALERACADHDPQIVWAKVDPRLASVRTHPRIQAVIARVGL